MSTRRTWVEMSDGKRLEWIRFVVWVSTSAGERELEFEAYNPLCFEGDPDLFKRVSFEGIVQRFKDWELPIVANIRRGECSEIGVRDCYVYAKDARVPFAVIRPAVFRGK